MERVFRRGTRFVDESGRQVQFNGVNLSLKGEKKGKRTVYSFDSVTEEGIASLHRRGINLIRLILTWDGVEPLPGVYQEEYLNHYRQIISWCEKYGIYFILDMHQDLYSRQIGDGAPDWASLSGGYPFEKPALIWAEGYFYSRAVAHCFENFWRNVPVNGKGLQDYYAAMWRHVAARFCDSPALLGFDVLNEPFPGLSGNEVFCLLIDGFMEKLGGAPMNTARYFKGRHDRLGFLKMAAAAAGRFASAGMSRVKAVGEDEQALREIVRRAEPLIRRFDEEYYSPFLSRMAAAIRDVTDRGILFMENCYYSNIGIPCAVRIPTVRGVPEEQVAFAPHAYDIFIDSPLYRYASNTRAGLFFGEHRRTQERLGVPVLVGEWGGFSAHSGYREHAEFLLRLFEENGWSRCYWLWDPAHFDRHPIRDMICRSYPQAVCGEVRSLCSDGDGIRITYEQREDRGERNRFYLSGPVRTFTVNGVPVPPSRYSFTPSGGKEQGGILHFSAPHGENRVEITVQR